MQYKILTVGDKEFKLRLGAKNCVDLENKLGESPLNILMRLSEGRMPTLGFIVTTLHCSLQALEHGYSIEKTYELYDKYVEGGGDMTEMLEILTDVFEVSGFFKREQIEKEEQVQETAAAQAEKIIV